MPALGSFQQAVSERCGLQLQVTKTEVYSQDELQEADLQGMKRAGVELDGVFYPGFVCYGIPIGHRVYVREELENKAAEVVEQMEEVATILSEDNQALWVVVHRSLAHKMDYHLSLSYPSDILPVLAYLDTELWKAMERAVGQLVPRTNLGWGYEWTLDIPVDTMATCSFQELFIRSPIKLRGFGLRSMVQSTPAAFIGALERSLYAFTGEDGICRKLEPILGGGGEGEEWWRALMASDTRTGDEFAEAWRVLQAEAEQCCDYLGRELDGALHTGPAIAGNLEDGKSSRQEVTEQREELREAVMREVLLRHPDQSARPAIAYPQLDKVSTAWKLALPGPTTGLTSPVFKEVMAMHLFLPSPACASVLGQSVGKKGAVVGAYGDEVMTAHLPEDSWRWRHDEVKLAIMNLCNNSMIRCDAEIFGIFRDLIPPELTREGGELQYGRQRVGLTPDLLLRLPTADGVKDCLGELKCISAGVSRYPPGKTEKQTDRRGRQLPGEYRRPLQRLDREVRGTPPGQTGALEARLQSYGELQCYVAGAWADCSSHLHSLLQACAESRVEHLCRSTGRQDMERQMSVIVGQNRRLMSTTIVRAHAQCLLSRIGVISPAARQAAGRREVATRQERQLRQERKAQWQATLRGAGWARSGRCHSLL